ncbi:efflux RND transporter periplasmic adaptor subunit [Pseudoxanthomonas koreensis]|uniref:efflux RND transporter periplasmic adaptor subunit n=1 Tax=Pseudoxanthomonas koreensis TaxID=266061 RepID=UPI0035A5FB7E
MSPSPSRVPTMPKPSRWKWMIPLAVVALALFAWAVLHWRGPALPGYAISSGPLVHNVVATGRVAALSRVQVGAEIAGVVLERRVMEGDRVAAGDLLVVLRARDLEARRDEARAALTALRQAERPDTEERLRQASAQLAQAQREHTRRRELGERQLVARESVEQAAQAVVAARAAAEQARLALSALSAGGALEAQAMQRLDAAQAELDRARIHAPVAGTVLIRAVEPGDTVSPGQVLLEIARDAPGEVLLALDEKNLALLEQGQAATCIADAYPDRPFAAVVHHIAPAIDPARGTVDVRLRIEPEVDFVREDMTVTATILTGQREDALTVANDALLDVGADGRARVLRVRGGRVHSVPVRLGLRGLAMSEVLHGLAAGDTVVAAAALGADGLPTDGDRIRIRQQPVPESGHDGRAARHGELPMPLD